MLAAAPLLAAPQSPAAALLLLLLQVMARKPALLAAVPCLEGQHARRKPREALSAAVPMAAPVLRPDAGGGTCPVEQGLKPHGRRHQ